MQDCRTFADAFNYLLYGGEYLSGFYKDDRLVPVVTLVVFFSSETWNGPRCIHDMFSVTDPDILSFVPDYRINLIAPGEMSDGEIDRFATSLREVLLFIKYSKDKDRLRALVSGDDRFKSVERSAVRVINAVTRARLEFSDDDEEGLDVCKAINDMKAEARAEGKAEGVLEGEARGRLEGEARGRIEGKAEGVLEQAQKTAYNLHDMGLPTDKIAAAVNVNLETVREWFAGRSKQIAT